MLIDLTSPTKVHLVGIGGAGMSAIAEILVGTGHTVTGSDLHRSVPRATPHRRRCRHPDRPPGGERRAGRRRRPLDRHPGRQPRAGRGPRAGVPVLRRAEILTAITRAWTTDSVAGTHGKTTTSAMLTTALRGAGIDPAFIVGGDLRDWVVAPRSEPARCSSSRPTRATARSSSSTPRRHRHQRRAGPPRALRRVREARSRPSSVRRAGDRAPRASASTIPVRPLLAGLADA